MVSPILLFLTMFGVLVVAPVTIPTVITRTVTKANAHKKVAKYEKRLRKEAQSQEKNNAKIKSLAKKYYRSIKRASRRVLPSYDNMNVANFHERKISRLEGQRIRLNADLALAKLNNNAAKVDKIARKIENNYTLEKPQTPYKYVETIKLDDGIEQTLELSSNAIYCNLQSTRDNFKKVIEANSYKTDSVFPYVAEVRKGDTIYSSISTLSEDLKTDVVTDFIADTYIDALVSESAGETPSYSFTTYDTDQKRNNKRTHQKVNFNTSEEILEYAINNKLFLSKDDFYQKAKLIAKEKGIALTINSKKNIILKKEPVKTKEEVKEKEEVIVCESKKTKKNFEKSLTSPKFAKTPKFKDFYVSVKIGDQEKYSLKTQSKARETTFTVDLLVEAAIAMAAMNNKNGVVKPITYSVVYKEKPENSRRYDEKSKEIVFNSYSEIKKFVIENYEISEELFNKKCQELVKEFYEKEKITEEQTENQTVEHTAENTNVVESEQKTQESEPVVEGEQKTQESELVVEGEQKSENNNVVEHTDEKTEKINDEANLTL